MAGRTSVRFFLWDARTSLSPGDVVVRVQPAGTPRNGTMGHTFVGEPDDGRFIGLVLAASLQPVEGD